MQINFNPNMVLLLCNTCLFFDKSISNFNPNMVLLLFMGSTATDSDKQT